MHRRRSIRRSAGRHCPRFRWNSPSSFCRRGLRVSPSTRSTSVVDPRISSSIAPSCRRTRFLVTSAVWRRYRTAAGPRHRIGVRRAGGRVNRRSGCRPSGTRVCEGDSAGQSAPPGQGQGPQGRRPLAPRRHLAHAHHRRALQRARPRLVRKAQQPRAPCPPSPSRARRARMAAHLHPGGHLPGATTRRVTSPAFFTPAELSVTPVIGESQPGDVIERATAPALPAG